MKHLLSLATLFLLTPVLSAGDWPSWRGPTGQGVSDEKDLPLTWNGKTGENVVWKVLLPGQDGKLKQDKNQSSPIVVKGKVIVTASYWPAGVDAAKNQPEHHVVCYNAADGKQLWDTTIAPGPWKFGDLRGGYTAPTPACDGLHVFVHFGSSVLAALDLDGKLVWRKDVVPFDYDVAISSSPVLYGDTIILQCDGLKKSSRLVGFDRKTGEVKWEEKRPQNNFSHSTPIVAHIGDKDQLIVASSNAVQGVDPANGKMLWWCAGNGDTVSPVFANGMVYSDSGRGGPGVAVDPSGTGDVTKTHLKWKMPGLPEGFSSPVIVGEQLYRVNNPGVLKGWKLATGELLFTERLEGASPASSPFTTPEGRIYVANAGKTFVVKAGAKAEVLAVNDLGDGTDAQSSPSAAVAAGRIFIKGRQYLHCIGKK
jgi:outer membrane protein assembly factor BamB